MLLVHGVVSPLLSLENPLNEDSGLEFPACTLPEVPLPEVPVGGRLMRFSRAWRRLSNDPWVVSIIEKGYRIPFSRDPPLTSVPPSPRSQMSSEKLEVLRKEVQDLLSKRAIDVVQGSTPGFYSHLFVVPKKNGKLRPIIDLSFLNRFICLERFKMETTRSIREAIRPGDWAVSIDLKDAYLHVPIHPSSRKYLRFRFEGTTYQFRVLPFGISTAPFLFTKLMVVVAAAIRRAGAPVLQYFDDWLLHLYSRLVLLDNLHMAWSLIQDVGLIPNQEKSDLIPSQDFVYVGMFFRTGLGIVSVPPDRVDALLVIVLTTLRKSSLTARAFLSLLGVLGAAADLVFLGRLHMRPIQLYLLSLWRPSRDPLEASVPIRAPLRPHLIWWTDKGRLSEGVPISPPEPDFTLLTDASLQGWGAHLEPAGLMTSGSWSDQGSLEHINNLELRAVFLALKFFHTRILDKCVMVASDNTTVVSYIRKQGGTHSLSLFSLTREIFLWCARFNVTLRAKHIPGKQNVLADYLSRGKKATLSEWSLNLSVAEKCILLWGPPTVDLFATRLNNKLPLYLSLVPDVHAWARDALSLNWNGLDAYAFPPFNLLPMVLGKIAQSSCLVTLIAPLWPQRAWFNRLLSLLVEGPRALPPQSNLLSQHGGRTLHGNVECLHLHVWRLSGDACLRRVFLAGLPILSRKQDDLPLQLSMTLSGEPSLVGVVNGKLIHSTPL